MGEPRGPELQTITVIGGGSGSFSILSGLRAKRIWCESIVTMMDSGGDSGQLRDAFGVLPPGDVRRCMIALSERSALLRDLFSFRFDEDPLRGRSFGNLFYLALTRVLDNERDAVMAMEQLLEVHGRVFPVTWDHSHLVARLANGSVIRGEANIDLRAQREPGDRSDAQPTCLPCIEELYLDPPALANRDALDSIARADAIVLAPGDVFTSLMPNLLVSGIAEALAKTPAPLIQIINLMTKRGETDGWSASRHVEEIARRAGRLPDAVLAHSGTLPDELVARYAAEGAEAVDIDTPALERLGVREIFRAPIMSTRSVLRHDPGATARALLELIDTLSTPP